MTSRIPSPWSGVMVACVVVSACEPSCTPSAPCGDGPLLGRVDFSEFDSAPGFGNLAFEEITPAEEFDFWAAREGLGRSRQVLHTGGNVALADLGEAARFALETPALESFGYNDCAPLTCGRHFVTVDDGALRLWSDDVAEFLGTIDSPTEAILIAMTHRYRFAHSDRRRAGVAATSRGFLIVATRPGGDCSFRKTIRYLLLVSHDGTLEELDRDTVDREPINGCVIT